MKANGGNIGKIYGQEKNITTYNLARMNMLLHGVKDSEFEIHHGDSLLNDWDMLNEMNPAKKWSSMPLSQILHSATDGSLRKKWAKISALTTMALLPNQPQILHSYFTASIFETRWHDGDYFTSWRTFQGGAEERIRTKLLKDGNIDAVIGLPANLFFSTGIPVCILVLKKCKKSDDVLFINASDKENFEKGKRQNKLRTKDIDKIIDTYKQRKEEERYSRPVSMDEIERNGYNLNISRYVSIAKEDVKIDLLQVNKKLIELESKIADASERHNKFLAELGLPLITKAKRD